MTVRKRPEIVDAYVSPVATGDPIGETRVRIGEEITIVAQGTLADRLYVRLGTLEPIRVSPAGRRAHPHRRTGCAVSRRPRPSGAAADSACRATAARTARSAAHRHASGRGCRRRARARNGDRRIAALSSEFLAVATEPACHWGDSRRPEMLATILRVTGDRLWHAGARSVEVIVGDAAIPVRPPDRSLIPGPLPTPTAVEVPISAATGASRYLGDALSGRSAGRRRAQPRSWRDFHVGAIASCRARRRRTSNKLRRDASCPGSDAISKSSVSASPGSARWLADPKRGAGVQRPPIRMLVRACARASHRPPSTDCLRCSG